MELREYIVESLERGRARTLDVVKDITPEELAWMPGPEANHIGFLLWHLARSEDALYHRFVAATEQVWTAQGWDRRFGLRPEDTGNGWTPQQVANWTPPPLPDLLQYMGEVRESVMAGLGQLDLTRLEEKPWPDRPEMTVANILHLLASHEAHHQGAIEYLIGLKRTGLSGG